MAPLEHAVEVTTLLATPVIGDAVLRVIVRADLVLAAGPGHAPHDAPAQVDDLGLALLAADLGQLAPQQLPRLFAVLVLAAAVLHGDDDAAGHVRQAHGAVGLVDVLAAGAARAHRLAPHVLRRDVVVALGVLVVEVLAARLGQVGEDEHADGARVRSALLLRAGHALHAVHARLGAQDVVAARRVDFHQRVRERAVRHGVVGRVACQRRRPALPRAKRLVHVQQRLGEEGGFAAARAGVDLDHARHVGERVRRDKGRLQPRRQAR